MEADLGVVFAKALDAKKLEKEPTMDFVESMEALPPIETVMKDTVQQLRRDKAGIFEENNAEKEEIGGTPSSGSSSDDEKLDIDDNIIDDIAKFLIN